MSTKFEAEDSTDRSALWPTRRVLLVEDDPAEQARILQHLHELDYESCGTETTAAAACSAVRERQPDLVLMGIHLGGEVDGIEAAEQIRTSFPVPIVFLAADDDQQTFERARRTQPFGYLLKPVSRPELHFAIELALLDYSVEQHLSETTAELNVILETVGACVVLLKSNRLVRVNRAFEDYFSWSRADAIGRSAGMVFPDLSTYRRFVRRTRQRMARDQVFREELELRTASTGESRWCRVTGRSINPEDSRSASVWILEDITEERHVEERLQLAATVFENTLEGVWIADRLQNIIQINRAFTEITGYDEAEALGQNPGFLNSGRHDPGFYLDIWAELGEQGRWEGEIWNRRKTGEVYPEWLSISQVQNDQGNITHYIGVFSDISKRKEFEERLSHMATHDTLTDLPNRFLFRETLQQSLRKARRSQGVLGVAYINLNRFKAVNEALGQPTGDEVLRQVGQRLRQIVRNGDMVARAGGDEFMLILEELAHSERAVVAIHRIMQTLQEPFRTDDRIEVHVGASIGVSLYPHDTDDWQSLLRFAEVAMQQARERGRNSYQFFTPEINQQASERIALESRLRHAVDRGEFTVVYQPIVDTSTARISGFEALLRWQHPERGWISPATFIPLAEEMGLIIPLGQFVLETACRKLGDLRTAGHTDLFISINLSAYQLHNPNLNAELDTVIRDAGIPADALHLEITESAAMHNTDAAIRLLGRLSDLGVSISLDDFGTGYSSLAHLKRLPIDCIKIDRSFVLELPDNSESRAIVEAIQALARALNLKTIVEGVENREQLQYLRSLGLQKIQGFYFSRPLPAEEVMGFLERGVLPGLPNV